MVAQGEIFVRSVRFRAAIPFSLWLLTDAP